MARMKRRVRGPLTRTTAIQEASLGPLGFGGLSFWNISTLRPAWLARPFAWYEEAGGLRATEETDSDRRRRRGRRMAPCLSSTSLLFNRFPLLVLQLSFSLQLPFVFFFVIVFFIIIVFAFCLGREDGTVCRIFLNVCPDQCSFDHIGPLVHWSIR